MATTDEMTESIRWFSETTLDDVPLVGGKNASLGEMVRELEGVGIGPRSIASTRRKLKLGRREFGLLAGVTSNAVYLWETGESNPSTKSRAVLVGLRKVGVRDARKILEDME